MNKTFTVKETQVDEIYTVKNNLGGQNRSTKYIL